MNDVCVCCGAPLHVEGTWICKDCELKSKGDIKIKTVKIVEKTNNLKQYLKK